MITFYIYRPNKRCTEEFVLWKTPHVGYAWHMERKMSQTLHYCTASPVHLTYETEPYHSHILRRTHIVLTTHMWPVLAKWVTCCHELRYRGSFLRGWHFLFDPNEGLSQFQRALERTLLTGLLLFLNVIIPTYNLHIAGLEDKKDNSCNNWERVILLVRKSMIYSYSQTDVVLSCMVKCIESIHIFDIKVFFKFDYLSYEVFIQ